MIVKVNKNYFKTKVLIDTKSQSIGMMGKKFDETFDSLLFLMGGKRQCFWMKNCIIPLDIIMIYNNKITKIHHDCPPCVDEDCPTYCGGGNMVLELAGGTCIKLGIEEGDDVEYIF
jgi:uncharacterized membrane protein (UPF0127 family)